MNLIGLDAASDRKRFGFAVGKLHGSTVKIENVGLLAGRGRVGALQNIAKLIESTSEGLIAIDAPMGWPEAVGPMLAHHMAGQPLAVTKNALFRRKSEIRLREIRGGPRPMEVAADQIARAAHEGLTVLGELRSITGKEIPLAWDFDHDDWSVIEVYPAATLFAHEAPFQRYKEPDQLPQRERIADSVRDVMPDLEKYVDAPIDAFDACLCLLAAADFRWGKSVGPAEKDRETAAKEGWIWAR